MAQSKPFDLTISVRNGIGYNKPTLLFDFGKISDDDFHIVESYIKRKQDLGWPCSLHSNKQKAVSFDADYDLLREFQNFLYSETSLPINQKDTETWDKIFAELKDVLDGAVWFKAEKVGDSVSNYTLNISEAKGAGTGKFLQAVECAERFFNADNVSGSTITNDILQRDTNTIRIDAKAFMRGEVEEFIEQLSEILSINPEAAMQTIKQLVVQNEKFTQETQPKWLKALT